MKKYFFIYISAAIAMFGVSSFTANANADSLCDQLVVKASESVSFDTAVNPAIASCKNYPTSAALKAALKSKRSSLDSEAFWNFAFKNVAQRFVVLSELATTGELPRNHYGQAYLAKNFSPFAVGLESHRISSIVAKAAAESAIEDLDATTIYANRSAHLQNINVMMEAMCVIGMCDR